MYPLQSIYIYICIIIRDNVTYEGSLKVAVHFNQPDHSLKNLRCVILIGDFKTTADRLIVNKRSYINSKHIQKV